MLIRAITQRGKKTSRRSDLLKSFTFQLLLVCSTFGLLNIGNGDVSTTGFVKAIVMV